MDTSRLTRSEDQILRSGSIKLDLQLRGGFRAGTVSELFGPEGGGKTTIGLAVASRVLAKGGRVMFIDLEHSLDGGTVFKQGKIDGWMRRIGVDPDNSDFEVARPATGEEVFELIEAMIVLNMYDLIVLDSMAAMLPKADLEGNIGESAFGRVAKLNSEAFKRVMLAYRTQKVERTHLMIINQARENMKSSYGGVTSPGGRALKHYAHTRLLCKRTGKDSDAGVNILLIRTEKNRFSPPWETTELYTHPDVGLDFTMELLEFGVLSGFIQKKGAHYTIFDPKTGEELGKGHGKPKTKLLIDTNEDLKKAMQKIAWEEGLEKLIKSDGNTPIPDEEENG